MASGLNAAVGVGVYMQFGAGLSIWEFVAATGAGCAAVYLFAVAAFLVVRSPRRHSTSPARRFGGRLAALPPAALGAGLLFISLLWVANAAYDDLGDLCPWVDGARDCRAGSGTDTDDLGIRGLLVAHVAGHGRLAAQLVNRSDASVLVSEATIGSSEIERRERQCADAGQTYALQPSAMILSGGNFSAEILTDSGAMEGFPLVATGTMRSECSGDGWRLTFPTTLVLPPHETRYLAFEWPLAVEASLTFGKRSDAFDGRIGPESSLDLCLSLPLVFTVEVDSKAGRASLFRKYEESDRESAALTC